MMNVLWSVSVTALLLRGAAGNMNGKPGQYKIANSNPQSGKTFSTDYASEYFDVYSGLIRQRYGEVFWRMMDKTPLPDAIRQRFEGKVMAITGYEVDQVMMTSDGKEVPVPITTAYNHHYGAYLLNSKHARLVQRSATKRSVERGLNHGAAEHWVPELLGDVPEVPVSTWFSEGNGGEMRLSYHGYPRGYAQLIASPDAFQVNPMQIDTWNRDAKQASDPAHAPGPLPRASQAPPGAAYSGLIECPCSTRQPTRWNMSYGTQLSGSCQTPVQNAAECFRAARSVVTARSFVERSVFDARKPEACSVVEHTDGSAEVYWNEEPGGSCGADASAVVASTQSIVNLTVSLSKQEGPEAATITIVGPADRWLGVGFGADSMCLKLVADECPAGGPYAIVILGDGPGNVTERKLDFHGPGAQLETSVTVKSNIVRDGVRTVVVTRPLAGKSDKYYTFDPSQSTFPFINAKGCSATFAQHCGHASARLNFVTTDVATCVCQTDIQGTIGGVPFPCPTPCAAAPKSDLRSQRNPTCFVQTYVGGLRCCKDGQSILDAEQEQPWPDHFLEYFLKFRIYFEEYRAPADAVTPSHLNLVRLYWQTEYAAGEYDIVQCLPGTPSSQCVQVITSRWMVRDMMDDCPVESGDPSCTGKGSTDPALTAGVKLIYAGPHCHAPHCLSMELYNADTGRLLCHMEPIVGQSSTLYNEQGFLAIPPCLWGNEEGLVEPELLSLDTTLLSVKRNNNTHGHTGEMASWQMRGVVIARDALDAAHAGRHLPRPAVATERRAGNPEAAPDWLV